MNNNLEAFKTFANNSKEAKKTNNIVWGYTRVSSKDQFDNNSLNNQKQKILNLAEDQNYKVERFFGEINESASSDFFRKQFVEMFEELKKTAKRPYAIIVYKMNRFSRTGMSGISLLNELVNNYGVHLIEVVTRTSTDSEDEQLSLMQSLIDARKENINKMQATIPGMQTFLSNGNWLGKAPRGYNHHGTRVKDYSKISPQQKITLNEEGKQLQQAWYWKIEGETDSDIIKRLDLEGVNISKQTLSSMWRKPFYCGVLVHKMLDNEPVQGNWEPMVSREVFLEVNHLLDGKRSKYKHLKGNEKFPLSQFIYCEKCNNVLTYYTVKEKGVDYYRCNYCKGMNINANTTQRATRKGAHDLFAEYLNDYTLDEKYFPLFRKQLRLTFEFMNKVNIANEKDWRNKEKELNEEMLKMTSKYARGKLKEEFFVIGKKDIDEELRNVKEKLMNIDEK